MYQTGEKINLVHGRHTWRFVYLDRKFHKSFRDLLDIEKRSKNRLVVVEELVVG